MAATTTNTQEVVLQTTYLHLAWRGGGGVGAGLGQAHAPRPGGPHMQARKRRGRGVPGSRVAQAAVDQVSGQRA